MKYAWVENGVIREIASGDPVANYHPDIAKNFSTVVPDLASPGDSWDGRELVKPIRQPKAVEVVEPAPEVKGYTLDFTADEKALHALFASMLKAARKA